MSCVQPNPRMSRVPTVQCPECECVLHELHNETPADVAAMYCGDARRWPELFDVNPDFERVGVGIADGQVGVAFARTHWRPGSQVHIPRSWTGHVGQLEPWLEAEGGGGGGGGGPGAYTEYVNPEGGGGGGGGDEGDEGDYGEPGGGGGGGGYTPPDYQPPQEEEGVSGMALAAVGIAVLSLGYVGWTILKK